MASSSNDPIFRAWRAAGRRAAHVLLVLLAALIGAPGMAAVPDPLEPSASAWFRTDQGAVRLVSTATATGTSETIRLGLEFRLVDGWKIYWRSPGFAGYPPHLDWQGSSNLREARVDWPLPSRFAVQGLESLGYKHEVVLPIQAFLSAPGQPLALRLALDYLTCSDICIPYNTTFVLDLPAGKADASAYARSVDRSLQRVPGDGLAHGLALEAVSGLGASVELVIRGREELDAPEIFIEGPDRLQFGAASAVTFAEGKRVARLVVPVSGAKPNESLTGTDVVVTVADGRRLMERRATIAPEAAAAPTGGLLLAMLGTALLGGLVLNLMPCVLPVLSLKLLGVVSHGGRAPKAVRLGFLASSLGVMAPFWAMAAAAVGLKAAGHAIGWGIQFQEPAFVVALILIVALFACNLWGWFEVGLPGWLASSGGQKVRGEPGWAGAFAAGAFTTLLATPCSAPFVGTAVGFALARGPVEIFAIFTALGLGLAMPYLLVALMPGLARYLPRPGRWMITLRKVLGFALAGTAAWLLWVLAAQVGATVAGLVGAMICVAAFGLAKLPGLLRLGLPVALGMLALAAPSVLANAPLGREALSHDAIAWTKFDAAAIKGLVAEGKVVFVDVTADWCITCQVNKRFVLYQNPVAERLGAAGLVAERADWTNPDPSIGSYLASFGRYGIPFNAVYGPNAPDGIALPEVLSSAVVLEALDKAGSASR